MEILSFVGSIIGFVTLVICTFLWMWSRPLALVVGVIGFGITSLFLPKDSSQTQKSAPPVAKQEYQTTAPPANRPQQEEPNRRQPSTQQNRQNNPPANAKPQNRQSNSPVAPNTNMQKAPIQVFQSFHRNITNKDYRNAYNCLSKDFQDSMSYEGWAQGFRTTVSSTVSNIKVSSQTDDQTVLTYTLTAVDNPGGTNRFKGVAVLVKTSEGWKIDDITNKTMK